MGKRERWPEVEKLFLAALECEPSRRAAFLAEACGEDEELRQEVESLLAEDETEGSFLEVPAVDLYTTATVEDEAATAKSDIGRRIGPYQILREIGHGGMGAVFLATRADEQYRQQVALKLIKRGMDTDFVLRRFRTERQILAALNHPNIARLLDGGVTEDRLPYLVMEYIEGQPIDAYCDSQKLTTAERLKLFRQVCAAVHYAHQHLIVHRDLKPSNILVTAEGVPKLLDFGIAKLLVPELTAQTLDPTAPAMRLMTPEYASPEQVRGEPVTTASDVYSLGVLLYELLTGHRPYRVKSRAPHEVLRAVCESEPEQPSTAITRVEEVRSTNGLTRITLTPESVSQTREGEPEKLRRRLKGDIDNIVLMAIRKEAQRRYASVEQFAEDIRRHLEGLPVMARKDTLSYRTEKFIRRNKASVVSICIAALVFLIASASLYWLLAKYQVGNSTEARNKGIRSIAVLPFVNASAGENMEYLSDGITESLINSLSQLSQLQVMARTTVFTYKGRNVDPRSVGRELKVDAVMMGRVTQRGDTLIVQADLVRVGDGSQLWGEHYNRKTADLLGVQEEIAREISAKLQLKLSGEEQRRLTKRHTDNAEAYQLYLRGRYHWSKLTVEEVGKSVDYFQQAIALDPNYALAYSGLADSYSALGSLSALTPAEVRLKAKAAAVKALERDETLAEAHNSLARVKMDQDWDWSGAYADLQRAIELNPNYSMAHQNYSINLKLQGRDNEGLAEAKRAQEVDPLSLVMNYHLGRYYYWTHQYDQAITQLRKTLDLDRDYWIAHSFLGRAYEKKGMYEQAVAEASQAVKLSERHPDAIAVLGIAYAKAGQRAEALKLLAELEQRAQQTHVSPYYLGLICVGLGEKDQAFAWLEKLYQEHSQLMVFVKNDPNWDDLRSDPRFQDLMRRVGF